LAGAFNNALRVVVKAVTEIEQWQRHIIKG
jgi:hypothetical protein